MSKSLGNSPNPLDLIKEYGADGVRTGMLFSSPAGNDLLFDIKLCEQGRNFNNKLWNAFRLVKGWEVDDSLSGEANTTAIAWFEARFNQVLVELEDHFTKFRISDALLTVYKLVWDDFCSWYLEMVKPAYEQPIDKASFDATIGFLEKLLKILHPFMPFITEEIWHGIKERDANDAIVISPWPEKSNFDQRLLETAGLVFEVVTSIRNVRNAKQISPKTALQLSIKSQNNKNFSVFEDAIKKLANLDKLEYVAEKVEGALSFVVQADEFFLPLEQELDIEKEKENMTKELEYTKGFLIAVTKKLSNERFVNNAPPQVVEIENKKKADAEAKIKALEESLASL